jgi:hypothetical protein
VKELKAQNTAHELAATRAREGAIRTSAEAKIKTYEKKLTVPMRALMLSQLVRELTAGAKLEETDAVKALDSMQDLGITERSSGADVDDPNKNDPDRGILKRVNELMEKDEEIRELRKSDGYSAAFSLACDKAEAEELATSRK